MVDVPLPSHLEERCIRHPGPAAASAGLVVHWMRAALRLDENPTFDVARTIAEGLGLPRITGFASESDKPTAVTAHKLIGAH